MKLIKKTILLSGANAVSLLAGVGTSALLARIFSPAEYGSYINIINIVSLLVILLNFGCFYSSGQMVFKKYDEKIIVSGGVILSLPIALSVSLLFWGGSSAFDFYQVDGALFLAVLILAISVSMGMLFDVVFSATGNIYELSTTRLYPKLIILIISALLYYCNIRPEYKLFLLLLAISQLTFYIKEVSNKLSLKNIKFAFNGYKKESIEYGRDVYVGAIFSVGAGALIPVLVGLSGGDVRHAAYYGLALNLTSPVSIVTGSVAAVYYKTFSESKSFPFKVILHVALTSLLLLTFIFSILDVVIMELWGKNYIQVREYAIVLLFATVFQGIGDIFGRFLSSKGEGVVLRNLSIILGIILIFGALLATFFENVLFVAVCKMMVSFFYMVAIGFITLKKYK